MIAGTAVASSTARLIGIEIDRQFEIEAVLGGGAFATVYRARQLGIERPVAIKVPTHEIATDPVMAKRFAREARATPPASSTPAWCRSTWSASSPTAAPTSRWSTSRAARSPTSSPAARCGAAARFRIARLIASALSETHAAGVIHRDLKPSNIVWRRDRNGDDRITLVDFGIATCKPSNANVADAPRLTSGGLIGTPHYMAPEQAQGDPVDARTDLYALGCVLFELLTGTTPFDGSGYEVLLAHLGRPIPPPSERAAPLKIIVPPAVDRLVVEPAARSGASTGWRTRRRCRGAASTRRSTSSIARAPSRRPWRARRPTNRPRPPTPLRRSMPVTSVHQKASVGPSTTDVGTRHRSDEKMPTETEALVLELHRRRWPRVALLGLGAAAVLGAGGFAAFKLTRHGPSFTRDHEADQDRVGRRGRAQPLIRGSVPAA